MLNDENQIKDDGDVRQEELDRVPRDSAPIVLETGIEHQLDQRQHTSRQIQENLDNTPAICGFAFIVDPRLRDILDNGDEHFHIGKSVYLR